MHLQAFFFSGGKWRDLAMVTKNHHYICSWPLFDPMTPLLGVLKSQSRPQLTLGASQVGFLQYSRFRVPWHFIHAVHPVGVPWALCTCSTPS